MSVLERLDACVAGLDDLHRRQRDAEIRRYCRRIERQLAVAIDLLDQLRAQAEADAPTRHAARLASLERWAGRVVRMVEPSALYQGSGRLDQSLSDLVAVLRDETGLPSKSRR